MSETSRSHRHHPRRHHRYDGRRHSRPPSPPSSQEYISDTESLDSREAPPRSHSRYNSKAIVIRDPYQVQAPPRALRRDGSESGDYEYTIPRDSDDARMRRQEERERERARERARRQKKEGGILIAVALFAASVVFCLDWCADDD